MSREIISDEKTNGKLAAGGKEPAGPRPSCEAPALFTLL
jgi:hypothetical protein